MNLDVRELMNKLNFKCALIVFFVIWGYSCTNDLELKDKDTWVSLI